MKCSIKSLITAFSIGITGVAAAVGIQTQDAKPTWELGKNPIDPAMTKGKVELVNGVVALDGASSFAIPAAAIGAQSDYTIEFEVKRSPGATGPFFLVSNTDEKNQTGLGFKYCPPVYNAGLLFINGNQTFEQRGFLGDKFSKITIVAKERRLMLFRDGLILAMTEEVKPSALPITFGSILKVPTAPYALRNIKIYSSPLFPTGFDASADRMRYCSGPGYAMQRVSIKDPTLPRILVAGDSISMGYRGFISEAFKGRAYVDYWVGGGWFEYEIKGNDFPGLRNWDNVLSNGPYDVVSWNATTLHMWNGAPGRCSEKNYPGNMTRVVEHLQKTAANTKFIWIRCTPWRTTPDTGKPSLAPERNDCIIRLNKVTDEIMASHGIPEVDLYSLCEKNLDTVPTGSKDALHWSHEVSGLMAKEIIAEIEKCLPKQHRQASGK